MPAALVPLISVIVGAAGVGTSIYEGVQSSNQASDTQKANQEALLKQQQSQANQANLTKQEAVLGAQGQSQEQTGGSLTDSGTAALTDLLAGYPGYQSGSASTPGTATTSTGTGIAPSAISGSNSPGSGAPGSGSGTPDIASILALLKGGSGSPFGGGSSSGSNISGGNWSPQPTQPQGHFELSNPVL